MSNDATDTLRAALRSFCPKGSEVVTAPQLAAVLGLTTESQKQVLRRRLREMVRRGELRKAGWGAFARVADWKPVRRGDGCTRMWRAIRVQDAGWTRQDIALIARVDATAVGRYLRWLEGEGLITTCGRKGNTTLWRVTGQGREHRQTPYPPVEVSDRYEAERRATAQLCRILLLEDPDVPATRRKIQQQLAVLVARFPITTTANGADAPPATEA